MIDEKALRLDKIKSYTKSQLEDDRTGHDYQHILRVVEMANRLIQDSTEDVDDFIVLAASYLHDVIDEKLVEDTQLKINEVHELLAQLEVSEDDISEIMEIITHMSFSKNIEQHYELSYAGQIVQDADRLDAIGAIGIARTFYYGGSHQHIMYDPEIKPREQMTHDSYRNNQTIINHFYEKLLKLSDLMNTDMAKKIALKRQKYMQGFLDEFKLEYRQDA